jgi:hypothetical protein
MKLPRPNATGLGFRFRHRPALAQHERQLLMQGTRILLGQVYEHEFLLWQLHRSFADRRGASHTSRKKALTKMVATRFRLYWGRLGYIEHVMRLVISDIARGWTLLNFRYSISLLFVTP